MGRSAGARGAIDLTTFEGRRRRIQGDGEPEKGPAAEAGIRALLEVRKKPGIDSSPFRKLFGAEAELGPAMVTRRASRPLGFFEVAQASRRLLTLAPADAVPPRP